MNNIQLILNQKLVELQSKNPRISHRYFAQKLGVSSGALSEILKGKRKISQKLASKIAERLHLNPIECAHMLGKSLEVDVADDLDYLKLSDDQFHVISEWPHFAILNLVKSDKCQHKVTWFAEQLNIPLKQAQDVVDRLLRLGMLTYQNKKYARAKPHFKTSDDILNLSIQKSNLEDLELIQEHLSHLEVAQRDLTSVTLLIEPSRMDEFKTWIRKAQDQFATKFESTKSVNPFRLTMALYPLKKSRP